MDVKHCKSCDQVKALDKFEQRSDTKKYRNQCKDCRNAYVNTYKKDIVSGRRQAKKIEVTTDNKKQCIKCKTYKDIKDFPKRDTQHGYRHECKSCKQEASNAYYQTTYNAVRRKRFKEDINLRLKRAQRNYIYKCLTVFKHKKQGSLQYLHCSLDHLKKWIEFQFVDDMNWDNYGTTWTVDHVLPLSQFVLTDKDEQYIAFDWKNLQPSKTNFQKSDKLLFSEWLKVVMLAHRFIKKENVESTGYQGISESLFWLRDKLRYGKNPSDINGQPASKQLTKKANGSETTWFWVY